MGLYPQQNIEKQINSDVSGVAEKTTRKGRNMNCLNDANEAMALRKTKQISHSLGTRSRFNTIRMVLETC